MTKRVLSRKTLIIRKHLDEKKVGTHSQKPQWYWLWLQRISLGDLHAAMRVITVTVTLELAGLHSCTIRPVDLSFLRRVKRLDFGVRVIFGSFVGVLANERIHDRIQFQIDAFDAASSNVAVFGEMLLCKQFVARAGCEATNHPIPKGVPFRPLGVVRSGWCPSDSRRHLPESVYTSGPGSTKQLAGS
ncbi:hypothetical protein BDP27DRAFT_1368098 [Rhodocollybia butyracea]|uniref:Uncharacterized protein n=1 Tax=Rhodocollybia butyracea TaxID=206335 RepID=A0A9P5PIR0_9AGAR|nr:hypothetical protein BDP27DRAFT_1368098 [Rhodocollybia butyracea]